MHPACSIQSNRPSSLGFIEKVEEQQYALETACDRVTKFS
jgi:hypothetical protein